MEIPSKYDPKLTEDKWYQYWLEKKFFRSTPDQRKPYTVVIPPPNVTGVLHMGHMLNNTIQDVLVRRARMQGKNACWVPGTDHASIATEARVVAKLASEGIKKTDLSRDEFLKHAWEWTHKHGGIILEQLKKLGASCDWDRTCFTMDDERSESVINVFVDLHKKGLIYRGVRMVNWDPQAQTAVSDEEVNYKEVKSKLYHIRYNIVGSDKYVVVATTRPETILGDTAICVHPEDERYQYLKGAKVYVPLIKREVPVIRDEYVDREFGTGVLKITPAHDLNDYELGQKYNLETIDIFNDNGTLNEKAQLFVGKDRFVVREEIVEAMKASGNIEKIEDYINKVGFSERTDAVIEPKLSMQWFLKMKTLSEPALENVMNDNIQLYPAKFKNTYRHWMENVKDWCISRQLWWGHRIPAYYINNSNDFVVANSDAEAVELARQKTGNASLTIENLKQDEDVLDTWFSSWLWPISVFDGIRNPDNEDIKYYYPTDDLVTAPEILFFWVARMIIAGYEYQKEPPFKNVYLTGIVRDKLGRKMSKSLGNSPDPLLLIEKYGADGVRVGMLLCSPAGNDLPFDEGLTEQGRNFGNKIWNAFRLVKSWQVDESIEQPEAAKSAIEWFDSLLNKTMAEVDDQFDKYRLSEALMQIYKLFWDEFSSWYLEMVKPAYQQPIDARTYVATVRFFEKLLKVLHPFMPFITEEIWHYLGERQNDESIMVSALPAKGSFDEKLIAQFDLVKEIVAAVRNIRQEKNLPIKEALELQLLADNDGTLAFSSVIKKLSNLSDVALVASKPEGAVSFLVKSTEYYVPLTGKIDVEEEIQKIEKELKYTQGFLESVLKKLSNERFVSGAPQQVLQNEQNKKADAEAKIKAMQERLAGLKG
ncbi:MAG: valine--tRNA ligase [Bacteroidota bacterium]|nr:valine--tRNA ligase [Bacteroidota bacterium]